MKQVMGSLNLGINGSAIGIAIASLPVLLYLDLPNKWQVWGAIVTGLVAGLVIGKVTEILPLTNISQPAPSRSRHKPDQQQSLLKAFAVGMESTAIPGANYHRSSRH